VIKVDVLRNQIDLEVISEPTADEGDNNADSSTVESPEQPMAVTLSGI
jgi:ribonuclease R